MTNQEISWVKAQAWWNDLQKIYAHTALFNSMSLIEFLETQRLEMFAVYMIKDSLVDYLECQKLAKIAVACIDRVDNPGLGDYKAPVIRTTKKPERPKTLKASVELKPVLVIENWSGLRTSEKEDIIHNQLPKMGVAWDMSQEEDGFLRLYKRNVTLVEV